MSIKYDVQCFPEDEPIEGNASAIDPETDASIAADIRAQLDAGNEWAWCVVQVTATADSGERGVSTMLCCCSYASEADFRACVYFEDLCKEAADALLTVTVNRKRQAITTQYCMPTNKSGARIKATSAAGSKYYHCNEDNSVDNHAAAVRQYLEHLKYYGSWSGAVLPDGTGYCFVQEEV